MTEEEADRRMHRQQTDIRKDTHAWSDRQTNIQAATCVDEETGRWTDRHTETQTNIQTDIQKDK